MFTRQTSTITREKITLYKMIRIYCRDNHNNISGNLCDECDALYKYAEARLSKCPFKEEKTTCKKCTVHCYRPQEKEMIRVVMRYSGPRMILYHPVEAIRHLIKELSL